MDNIKIKFTLPDYRDLVRYGKIESDYEVNLLNGIMRTRKIRYMGILYHLNMLNGEVTSLKQWDSFSYDENKKDIEQMSDKELADKLMFSDRDRKNNFKAEHVYWLCINEINRRIENGDDKEI